MLYFSTVCKTYANSVSINVTLFILLYSPFSPFFLNSVDVNKVVSTKFITKSVSRMSFHPVKDISTGEHGMTPKRTQDLNVTSYFILSYYVLVQKKNLGYLKTPDT